MAKFKYLIVNLFDGTVHGTDDEDHAKSHCQAIDEYAIIDVENALEYSEDGSTSRIPKSLNPEEEGPQC